MTFTEAALEVLRSASEPLHYKKITELAIERNLLSHVGKTPEVTMSSRLATLVKKDRGQSPIIKVRPGVFAIRESAMHTDTDPTVPSLLTEAIPTEQSEATATPSLPVERPKLPGADVFPEEEGDDAPILAGLEEESDERGPRRRRRRRRGKGGSEIAAPEAGAEPRVLEREGGSEEPSGESRSGGRGPDALAESRDRGPRNHERGARNHERGPRGPERGGERDRGPRNHERGPDRGGRGFERGPQPDRELRGREEPAAPLDLSRQPGEGDLLGKDLADAAFSVLSRGDRSPATFTRIADMLVRRGRLSGSPEALAPTVAAALRADAARAQRTHGRARFRISDQRVSLTEWLMPREAVRTEENAENLAEQQRDHVRRAFVNRLNELPAAGFAELVATWLNAEGVTALRAVRRPGSSAREFHFAGILRRGAEENRLALIVLRGGRDLGREHVVEARGSLQHYSNATGAWLVTTGRINPTGREEAASEGGSPCALFAGVDLARSMEKLGIGMKQHFMTLSHIDFDLLEALGDGSLQPVRQEREQGPGQRPVRDRDGDRGRDRDRDGDRNRDRHRGGDQDRDAAGSHAQSHTRPDSEPSDTPSVPQFDLLDPRIAEESRLVPEARTWSDANPEEADMPSAIRLAPPIRVGDEAEEFDAGEIDIEEDEELAENDPRDLSKNANADHGFSDEGRPSRPEAENAVADDQEEQNDDDLR